MSPAAPPHLGDDGVDRRREAEGARRKGRTRQRHRKRRATEIIEPSWRWWQLLAALLVALVAGGITILLVRGSSSGP